jgi:hypothetical protein
VFRHDDGRPAKQVACKAAVGSRFQANLFCHAREVTWLIYPATQLRFW